MNERMEKESGYVTLLEEVGQELCTRLSTESTDWDSLIVPALIDFHAVLIPLVEVQPFKFINGLRCLAEAIYATGYKRGQLDAKMPEFVVAEE
jgi:hypothetical protein